MYVVSAVKAAPRYMLLNTHLLLERGYCFLSFVSPMAPSPCSPLVMENPLCVMRKWLNGRETCVRGKEHYMQRTRTTHLPSMTSWFGVPDNDLVSICVHVHVHVCCVRVRAWAYTCVHVQALCTCVRNIYAVRVCVYEHGHACICI